MISGFFMQHMPFYTSMVTDQMYYSAQGDNV